MNILVFYSDKNSKNKHDATGAFIPEAKAFQKYHEISSENMIPVTCVGVPKYQRKAKVFREIEKAGTKRKIDAIAFFGHGWPSGIQFGIGRKDIPDLAKLISQHCYSDLKIVLYACLTAENDERDKNIKQVGTNTDGGFADLLRDELARNDVDKGWVDGHKTFGHATWNPFCVRFLIDDVVNPEFGAQGGAWLVAPRSQYWRAWVRAMKTSMRLRFCFLSEFEIKAELAGVPWTKLTPQ
jgi:hypothetical protein